MQNERIILLADDDLEDKELLEEAILQLDPTVRINAVSDGRQVISYLQDCHDDQLPCLIVLDYNMPLMNGPQVLDAISNISRYNLIPKLIWSTSNSEQYKKICIEKGATSYLTKPHNSRDLRVLAKKMMEAC